MITTWVVSLKSHTPTVLASGMYKGQGTWSGHSSPAEKCRDQRNSSIHHVQYNIDGKCWARPQEHCAMYMGRGQAFSRGPRTTDITSTTRPPPKAEIVVSWLQMLCPWFCFWKRIKVVPSCHLPLQVKYELFLKDGSPSSHHSHLCSPHVVVVYTFT